MGMYRLLHVEDSFPKETIKTFYKEIIFYFGLHSKCEGTMQISQQLIIRSISTKPFHLFEGGHFSFSNILKNIFLLSK